LERLGERPLRLEHSLLEAPGRRTAPLPWTTLLDGNDDHTSNCNKLKRQIEELCMQIKLASLQRPRSQREEAARVLAENMLSEAH
jgi:hypothetical protein